jgi:RHS repeat-associated protein
LYGSGRIGLAQVNASQTNYVYELADHLGNVRATVQKESNGSLKLVSAADYYPFGMIMPNKTTTPGEYRFGYQGQFAEKDEETGYNQFELRLWDGRLGRWLTTDPYEQFHSPYLGMGNSPIMGVDPDGGDWYKTADGKEVCIIGARAEIEGYTWLRPGNYTNQINEVVITNKANYISDSGPRAYSLWDLPVRENLLRGEKNYFGNYKNPITRWMLWQEENGNYAILNSKEYWKTYGHDLGMLMIADEYINMASLFTPSGRAGKGPKKFNYTVRRSGSNTLTPVLKPEIPSVNTTKLTIKQFRSANKTRGTSRKAQRRAYKKYKKLYGN